mmetsp:Transcript_18299/g.45835  ORF Transcript_18299/g.45835 Transcript_18299/m.45835 type:complete len:97 (+) Transcript_18299:366-656(+)
MHFMSVCRRQDSPQQQDGLGQHAGAIQRSFTKSYSKEFTRVLLDCSSSLSMYSRRPMQGCASMQQVVVRTTLAQPSSMTDHEEVHDVTLFGSSTRQ